MGSTEWNHIHLHYTGVKAKVSETDICEICGGEKNAKTICVSTKHSRWVRKSFCSYLTTFIYWALICLQDTELQFQRKRKKNLIKKAEYFGGLSLAVLVDYAASKRTPTRSISVNAYYSSDNTSAIFWELSEILK